MERFSAVCRACWMQAVEEGKSHNGRLSSRLKVPNLLLSLAIHHTTSEYLLLLVDPTSVPAAVESCV